MTINILLIAEVTFTSSPANNKYTLNGYNARSLICDLDLLAIWKGDLGLFCIPSNHQPAIFYCYRPWEGILPLQPYLCGRDDLYPQNLQEETDRGETAERIPLAHTCSDLSIISLIKGVIIFQILQDTVHQICKKTRGFKLVSIGQ